jgi:hypothetical protein
MEDAVKSQPAGQPATALVITDEAISIQVAELTDERTPEGMVCLATTLGDRVVARCVVSPEAAGYLGEVGFFGDPVRLALTAHEAPPGLQCRLFALVQIPREILEEGGEPEEEDPEPWAVSVPSSDYERVVQDESDDGEESEADTEMAAVLLGHVVRFTRDRRHPASLPLEAADVLSTIVQGRVAEVVDKLLEDLLGDATDA